MDIYNYIPSSDIAEHCKAIGHVFTPLEMAVIVARGNKTTKEKHTAWREVIGNYPDMPIHDSINFDAKDSLHDYLRELIEQEEKRIEEFYSPSENMFYRPVVWRYAYLNSKETKECSDMGCHSTAEKAWNAINEHYDWKHDGVVSAYIKKETLDEDSYGSRIDVNDKGEITDISGRSELYSDYLDELDLIFIHLPVPFQPGDILVRQGDDEPFVIENLPHWNDNPRITLTYEDRVSGRKSDGSDMIGWGLYVSDAGVLYGDHTGWYDYFEYYRGKFEGNNRLLHYVNLYMKKEIRLPELLTMQCRIMLENQLDGSLDFQNHGCYISKEFLAENQLAPEDADKCSDSANDAEEA